MNKNFPPRIPRWTGKFSARILGGIFPGEDSSLNEKKATEEVVLVKFFVVHMSEKLLLRIHRGFTISQRGRRAEQHRHLKSRYIFSFSTLNYRGSTIFQRGSHTKRENFTEGISSRSSCGQEFLRKISPREYLLKPRTTILQRGITVGRRGQILNPPRSSVGNMPARHQFFSTEAGLSDCVGQGVLKDWAWWRLPAKDPFHNSV